MIVTVGAHKGGVGKTTTAVMTALLLARERPTVLIDADRQGSATVWREVAEDDGYSWPSALTTTRWPEDEALTLPPADLSHVVIDTGPNDPGRFRDALRLSDTALIPVGARAADVIQLGDTVADVEAVAQERTIMWGVVITMRDARTRERVEAPAAMQRDDLPAMTTTIPYGALYRRAFGTVPDRFGAYADLVFEVQTAHGIEEGTRAH